MVASVNATSSSVISLPPALPLKRCGAVSMWSLSSGTRGEFWVEYWGEQAAVEKLHDTLGQGDMPWYCFCLITKIIIWFKPFYFLYIFSVYLKKSTDLYLSDVLYLFFSYISIWTHVSVTWFPLIELIYITVHISTIFFFYVILYKSNCGKFFFLS